MSERVEGEARALDAGRLEMGREPATGVIRDAPAADLGLTIETVSRTLTQLRKEATITLKDNRHIEAVGIDMLEDLAEGL